MWAWISGKLASVIALLSVAAIIVVSLLKQGQQKEELKQEKEKAKEQDTKHEKQVETIRTAEDVKAKNANVSDSTIVNRLRKKWQRD